MSQLLEGEELIIRDAMAADVGKMLELYRPYVLDTPISFEVEVPSVQEFLLRVEDYSKMFPWLVCEFNERLVGYAYAMKFRNRSAYSWSVESSVYVAKEWHRRGIGRVLYKKLFEIIRRQGISNVFAGTTLPNLGSVALHEGFGFRKIGVFKKVGYKFEKWWHVAWWQLELSRSGCPSAVIPYPHLPKDG